MRTLILFFLAIIVLGCKVEVNSSDGNTTFSNEQNLTENNTTIDNNITTDLNTSIDTNTTNTTTEDNQTSTNSDLLFQAPQDALYDKDACYSGVGDTVLLQDYNSNESPRESDDDSNGISIMSLYTQTLNPNDSRVIAFYQKIPDGITLSDVTKRENVYGDNSQFVLMFDPIWKNLTTNTVYVQTPALDGNLPKCYRIIIKNIDTGLLTPQQVYRYKN